jgi:hypothetical protein
VQGRGRESSRKRDGTSGGKKRKEGKKKKKKVGKGRWGAGQLGPTNQLPMCGIVPLSMDIFFKKIIIIKYSISFSLHA